LAKNKKKRRRARWIFVITSWTFILALSIGFIAHYTLNEIQSLSVSFLILIIVIVMGILFDLVGTAAAAANIAPLNAKAARKVTGAKRAVYLVKNAEQVANFCNDVVGDISGIISGTLAAFIVIKIIISMQYSQAEFYLNILLTALVAAVTVGGKAWGKVLAINHSTEVILVAGLIITRLERPFGWINRKGKITG
jgi:Mg2+/Co2+ transporter CorB